MESTTTQQPRDPRQPHQARGRHPYPIRLGRMAAAALFAGGLATSVLVAGTSGASVDHSAKKVVVSVSKNATFGKILVSGKTLYTLAKPSTTACTSSCVAIWPELVLPKGVKKATAGPGVKASKLGTVHRAGGVLQVTYGGKALYYFSGDSGTGKVTGNITDLWGKWSDVVLAKANGTHTTSPPATSSSGGAGF